MEEWRDILGYENIYQVSNFGRIKRLKNSDRCKEDRLLKIKSKNNGYKYVCLSKNGKYKYPHVHRLVAFSFIPLDEKRIYVNHKDMDKSNNRVENLEWCTTEENNKHARENKVFANGNKKGILNALSKQVCQKNIDGDILFLWESTLEISNHYNISVTAISRSARYKTISIGFMWEYISKEYYLNHKDKYKIIPKTIVLNKRKRDLTKAINKKKELASIYTKEYLIEWGCKCFYKYGRIIRKEYDIFAKENKILTYVPVVNRFGSWDDFKKEVSNNLLSKIQLPI
jgi:hypothetical protein